MLWKSLACAVNKSIIQGALSIIAHLSSQLLCRLIKAQWPRRGPGTRPAYV